MIGRILFGFDKPDKRVWASTNTFLNVKCREYFCESMMFIKIIVVSNMLTEEQDE